MAASMRLIFLGIAGLLLAACQTLPVPEAGTVYLVRHAEKVTAGEAMVVADPRDPPLTEEGEARSAVLAELMADTGLKAIWSTDYTRTRDTAQPTADMLELELQLYNPSDLIGFAAQLKSQPDQTVLVVGHSNTTPQLVEALGGVPGTPIYERSEYDRLYVVDLGSGRTELKRYGAPYLQEASEND